MNDEKVSIEIQVSDTHIGHKTAIMYPDSGLDYKPNEDQRWLFKAWSEYFLPDVEAIIKKWKPKHTHLSLLGDMGDIDYKHRSAEFWTKDPQIIVSNAIKLFEPLTQMVDSMHTVRGTKAHIGEAGGIDERIAAEYGDLVDPRTRRTLFKGISVPAKEHEQYSHWYAEFLLSGVRFEIAHHGRNRTKWTDFNGLNSLKNEIILKRVKNKQIVPDVISRGHFHYSGHTISDELPYVIAVPSWQLTNDFIYRIDPTVETPHVGGHVVVCKGGQIVDTYRLKYVYERKPTWSPK